MTLTALIVAVAALQPSPAHGASLNIVSVWGPIVLNDAGQQIVFSSPIVANLDGKPAIVVGDRKGRVLAYHVADGSPVPGWLHNAGAPVDAPASVSSIGPLGRDVVFIGTGTGASPTVGGYLAINPNGTRRWYVEEVDPPSHRSIHHGVASGIAQGMFQGVNAVVGGSMGQNQNAMYASSGGMLPGFPWFQADSNLTTPAIADVFGNGKPVIIEGGDGSNGLAYDHQYKQGGHLRVLNPYGNLFQPYPNLGLICERTTDEIVRSSPAVGQFVKGGTMAAVFGTGTHFHGTSTNHLIAMNAKNCALLWDVKLDGDTSSSPALADLLGDGKQKVVMTTRNGSVWALDGANGGKKIWQAHVPDLIIGSAVTADLRNLGRQDVVVPTVHGVRILDGKTGASLGVLPGTEGYAFQNAPLVTADPNGRIGITVAGYNGLAQGVIRHYQIVGSDGTRVEQPGAWPMFHRDRHLRGFAPLR